MSRELENESGKSSQIMVAAQVAAAFSIWHLGTGLLRAASKASRMNGNARANEFMLVPENSDRELTWQLQSPPLIGLRIDAFRK